MRKLKNYWRKFFVIQSGATILLSIIGSLRSVEGMYWWMGVSYVDMVVAHAVFYEEEENK